MGTSVMKKASILVAALVVVVALLGSSASAAIVEFLTVKNDLPCNITVLYKFCPPCEPVGPCFACQTPKFTVPSGQSEHVEPGANYPLEYLKIQVGDVDQVYCLPQFTLQFLSALAVIEVGPPSQPGDSACSNSELYVHVSDRLSKTNQYTCLEVCSSVFQT